MIQIELEGKPVAWAAPRFYKNSVYDTKSKSKEAARWQIKAQYRDPPIQGPIYLDLTFFMPIPKATSKVRKKEMMENKIFPMGKPDTTNLQKLIEDCLTGIVFEDDSQCTDVNSRKRFREKPGILIKVYNLNHEIPAITWHKIYYADLR